MEHVELLIVGQGMAGSALAIDAEIKNISCKIIDNSHYMSSSIMSAGMYNPIVFKRVNKSWMADEVLPALLDFDKKVEQIIGNAYHENLNVIRCFSSLEDQITWFEKMDIPSYASYLSDGNGLQLSSAINAPYGFGEVKQAGRLRIKSFLQDLKHFLIEKNKLVNEAFIYESLQFLDERNCWQYKNIQATHVVFAEGFQIMDNPYFKWLPIRPNKGQLIEVKCEQLNMDKVLNGGFFIQPLGSHVYRIGATYEWNKTDDVPTEERKVELLTKFKSLIDAPVEVVKHTAGVRPTVQDRRPIIGEHPIEKGLHVFNGFGTKAVMLAPFFANEFMTHLFENSELNKEVNCERFYKHYNS